MSWIDDLVEQQQGNSVGGFGGMAPADNPGVLAQLGHAGLGGLQYLGETLDKPGRALRGLLAGRPEELLNLIPFSDTLGITDPTKAVRGRDLLRQWGAIDQEDTWGNFFGGLGLEIGLDPLNALTFGTKSSLTGLGQLAAKSEQGLAKTAAERIVVGQSGLMGLRTPFFTDMLGLPKGRLPLMTGEGGQAAALWLAKQGERIADLPGASLVGSAFQYGRGFTGDKRYYKGSTGVAEAERGLQREVVDPLRAAVGGQTDVLNELGNLGVARPAAEGALEDLYNFHRQANSINPPAPFSPILWDLPAADRGAAVDKLSAAALGIAEATGEGYNIARDSARGFGTKIGEAPSVWGGDYAHQRAIDAGRNIHSQQTGRTIPFEVLPGGELQLKQLVSDVRTPLSSTGIAGLARDVDSQGALAKQLADPANYKPMGEKGAERLFLQNVGDTAPRRTYTQLVERLKQTSKGGYDPGFSQAEEALVKFVGANKDKLHPDDLKMLNTAAAAVPGQLDDKLLNHAIESWSQRHAQDVITKRDAVLEQQIPGITSARKAGKDFSVENVDKSLLPLVNLTDDAITQQSRSLGRWLSEIDPSVAASGRGIRRPDPAGNLFEYVLNTSKQKGRAEGAIETIAREAKPYGEMIAGKSDTGEVTKLSALMDEIGLNAIQKSGRDTEFGGKLELLNRLVGKGKSQLADEARGTKVSAELDRFAVPADLAEVLKKELKGPDVGRPFGLVATADKWLSLFRSGVTVPFPPYHLRNLSEAITQQGMGGGLGAKNLKDAYQFIAGSVKDPESAKELRAFAEEAFAHNAGFRNQPLELLGKGVSGKESRAISPFPSQGEETIRGAIGGWFGKFKPGAVEGEKYLTLDPTKQTVIQRGVEAHLASDQANRFAQFIGLRRQGFAPERAAEVVRNSQLDYSLMTNFEQQYARRFLPFYSFSKQNIARTARQLQDPGPLASMVRTATAARANQSIPDWVTPGMALPAGMTEDGKSRFLSGFGLPLEDEMLSGLLSLAGGNVKQGAQKILSGLDPISKLAVESATGTQLYSGRKMEELKPSPLLSFLPRSVALAATQAVSATPASRLITTLDKTGQVAMGDRPILETLANLVTGVRTSAVDLPQIQNQAARATLDRLLTASGQISHRTDAYVKPEFKGQEDPQVLALLQLMKELEKQASSRRKEQLLR